MNKKTVKIIATLLTFMMVMAISTSAFAINVVIEPNTNSTAVNTMKGMASSLMGLLQVAGVIVSIVVLIVLGIKYMMGSTAEKAEYKKTLMPYFIGALLIFGASAISGLVIDFAEGINA